jgi:RNA polymerase sigma-70 factor (ECF subfamily)
MLDEAGFDALYDRAAERLLVFLARRVVDAEVALDLWAETLAQAFAGRRRFRGASAAEEEAWLFGIARRQLALYIRRGRAERRALERLGLERPVLDDADLERLEELAGLGELRTALAREIDRLSQGQRDAVRLRVVEELPYPEVAARLQVTEQTARARVSRALRRLGQTAMEAAP